MIGKGDVLRIDIHLGRQHGLRSGCEEYQRARDASNAVNRTVTTGGPAADLDALMEFPELSRVHGRWRQEGASGTDHPARGATHHRGPAGGRARQAKTADPWLRSD